MQAVFGIVGWKNSGKTTLMERLVFEMTKRGLAVSTVKHAHHSIDIDHKGTDSYRHRMAGAKEVMLTSERRWALINELRDESEPSLDILLGKMSPVDLILIEGYKKTDHFKIECHRNETSRSLLAQDDDKIIAIASDYPVMIERTQFVLNDTAGIADFILRHQGLI